MEIDWNSVTVKALKSETERVNELKEENHMLKALMLAMLNDKHIGRQYIINDFESDDNIRA